MTPKRTAHPVARMLAERPAAPPLLPPEVLPLGDGDVVPEPEGLLLDREEILDETLEVPDEVGFGVVVGVTEEEAEKVKSTDRIQGRWGVQLTVSAESCLNGLSLGEVRGGTLSLETLKDGCLVSGVHANTGGVGAGRKP